MSVLLALEEGDLARRAYDVVFSAKNTFFLVVFYCFYECIA